MMGFVAMRALEGAGVRIAHERIGALARYFFTRLHGKSLQTSFAFDQPDQSHFSAPLRQNIPWENVAGQVGLDKWLGKRKWLPRDKRNEPRKQARLNRYHRVSGSRRR